MGSQQRGCVIRKVCGCVWMCVWIYVQTKNNNEYDDLQEDPSLKFELKKYTGSRSAGTGKRGTDKV